MIALLTSSESCQKGLGAVSHLAGSELGQQRLGAVSLLAGSKLGHQLIKKRIRSVPRSMQN